MSIFTFTSIHHQLPTDLAKRVLSAMIGSFNYRAIAYARMAIRQDAYDEKAKRTHAGYREFSDEPNIDKRAEAEILEKEIADKAVASQEFGHTPMIPARTMAAHMMALRGFCAGRTEVLGIRSEREKPQPISDSLDYMLSLDPITDREKLKMLAEACDIDPLLMETAVIEDHTRDITELAKNISKIKDMLGQMHCDELEEGDAEAIFDALPEHIQYKLIAKVITVYERLAKSEILKVVRGSFDAASNYKLLKGKRAEAVAWLKEFSMHNKAALGEYMDRGGDLQEFDADIVTDNKSPTPPVDKVLDSSTKAAAARLKEDNDEREAKAKAKMQRAPAPAK